MWMLAGVLAASPVWGATTLTFGPTNDSYVRSDRPTTNFGSAGSLVVDKKPVVHSLLKFVVSGIGTGTVTSAKLRLYNVDGSNMGGSFYRVSNNAWSESTVTWQTAPPADPTPLASLGAVSENRWHEVDLTGMIIGDGTYSLRITSTASNAAGYTSKEGIAGFAPQIVVTVGPAGGQRTLTVTKSGTGGGTVSSSPAGIDCGPTCQASFEDGTAVSLTATAAAGSVFAGWGGACTGTGPCSVAMTADRSVTAAFNAESPPTNEIVFSAAGDHGANSNTAASLKALDASGSDFYLALGDLDYDETPTDAAWCDYVKSRLPTLGPEFPFQLVVGNHEQQGGSDGYILNHAACLPDRLGSTLSPTNQYAAEYYFDYPASSPLVRVIMIGADLTVENVKYDYVKGNAHYAWLSGAIDDARARGVPWVVVGMHENCITAGIKSCSIGPDLMNLLVQKRVDLVLQGHDHNYQRSKQLALNGSTCAAIVPGAYDADCVVDNGADNAYAKGSGTVLVIDGTFGKCCYSLNPGDPEAPYFAASNSTSLGFTRYVVSPDRIVARFEPSVGGFTDSFTISSGSGPGDVTPPTATIISPANGATVSGTTSVQVSASDDVGVSRVELFVDGVLVSTDFSAPYSFAWDTTTAGNGEHVLLAKAHDGAGNVGSSSISVRVSNGGTGSLTFSPDADTFVRQDLPSTNFGTASRMEVDNSPVTHGLMRFTVNGIGSQAVTSAKLRLYCTNGSTSGGNVHAVSDDSWGETTVTWQTAPAAQPTPLASLGAVSSGNWYEVDLSSLVTGDGTYSLRLISSSSDGADYTSKEGSAGFAPQLVVTMGTR